MPDLIIHRLPFGGVAFEPVSDAGNDWLADFIGGDYESVFTNDDACMAGLPDSAVGLEPRDAECAIEDATLAGLTMEEV